MTLAMTRRKTNNRRMAKKQKTGDGALEEQRRNQLVSAVVACISEEGFERTTTRNIADRAGVSIGMLNYYYKSKKELVVDAIRHANRGVQRALADTDAIPFGPRRLEFIIRRTMRNEYSEALPLAFRLAVMAAAVNDTELQQEVASWLEDGRAKFEKSITAGIEAKVFRDDCNARLLSVMLYGAMTGLAVQSAVSPKSVPIDLAVDALLRLLHFFEETPATDARARSRSRVAESAELFARLETALIADPKLSTQDALALNGAIRALYDSYASGSRRRARVTRQPPSIA
jgi:AcrR family transcriptional regulator